MLGILTGLFSLLSMYNCQASNITAANTITNVALANCVTSLILLHQISPMHASILQGERSTQVLSSTVSTAL